MAEGVRARILRVVQERPGVGILEMSPLTGHATGTVRGHVRALLAEGAVERRTYGSKHFHYPSGTAPDEAVSVLDRPRMRHLLAMIAFRGMRSHTEIVAYEAARGEAKSTTQWRLATLAEQGFVRRQREGKWTFYEPLRNDTKGEEVVRARSAAAGRRRRGS